MGSFWMIRHGRGAGHCTLAGTGGETPDGLF
jgi:hypothetical protein